jgi:hypothetical protein
MKLRHRSAANPLSQLPCALHGHKDGIRSQSGLRFVQSRASRIESRGTVHWQNTANSGKRKLESAGRYPSASTLSLTPSICAPAGPGHIRCLIEYICNHVREEEREHVAVLGGWTPPAGLLALEEGPTGGRLRNREAFGTSSHDVNYIGAGHKKRRTIERFFGCW